MLIAKVIGTVISTRKNTNLIGCKFLIVEPLKELQGGACEKIVAVDNVGAGVGETVLVTLGSAARIGCGMNDSPIDAAIVGIVDDLKDIVISRQ
jgi:ethanolamine utilization protein EutN